MRRLPMLVLLLAVASREAMAGDPQPATGAVAKKYAKMLDCAVVSATPIPGSYRRIGNVNLIDYEVKGCGQFLIADAYIALGVVFAFDDRTVRRRAPIETNCPADQVKIDYLDAKTRIVTGCGSRVTYLYTGEPDYPGSWTANFVQSPAAAPTSPAPATSTPAQAETQQAR